MARDFATVNLAIWQDPDFRGLPADAKLLYLTLWTHPQLSRAGVVDWRPGRLAALIDNTWTAEHLRAVGDCLEARLFIVTDEQTEECLIRSWVRFDGLMKSPVMAITFANEYAAVVSTPIREVIVHELHKLRDKEPTLAAWGKGRVLEVLEMPSLDPRSRDLPTDPLTPALTPTVTPSPTPSGGKAEGSANPSTDHPPTPAPAPAPLLHPVEPEKSEKPRPAKSGRPAEPDGFVDFWKTYPRRDDKGHARTAWTKAVKKATPEAITAGAARYATAVSGKDRQFIALPSTWLNGERWDDEYAAAAPTAPSPWDRKYIRGDEDL